MKVLILSEDPSSLFIASKLIENHASVTLWGQLNPLEIYNKLSGDLKVSWNKYLQSLRGKIVYRNEKISFIKKSFLDLDEKIKDKSRMVDTFQVIFQKNDIEYFEEFDFIIDQRSDKQLQISDIRNVSSLNLPIQNVRRVDILSSHIEVSSKSQLVLLTDDDFILSKAEIEKTDGQVHIACLSQNVKNSKAYLNFKEECERDFESLIQDFESKRALGEKVLEEPKAKIYFYDKYSLISFDKFDDVENLIYATFQAPDFRGEVREAVKVIGVDCVSHLISATMSSDQEYDFKNGEIFCRENEDGLYKLPSYSCDVELSILLDDFDLIWKSMLQFFSKA